ncbi:MAG: hypothetical protein Q9190_001496 [Brigantiaea leucoxantha]
MALKIIWPRRPIPDVFRTTSLVSLSPVAFRRHSSTEQINVDKLREEMLSRKLPVLKGLLATEQTKLLQVTLEDFLPSKYRQLQTSLENGLEAIPLSHTLVYFPPMVPLSSLLSDGTDPLQAPGEPFTRRMWAGGELRGLPRHRWLPVSAVCKEEIVDVYVKGLEGDEKVFVKLLRKAKTKENPLMSELRTIVFMRERPEGATSQAAPRKVVQPPHEPDLSHTLIPTAALLFRFSALTFNAHAIHLDKQHCVKTEGHRNLLVHGPLSLVLMMELLRTELGNPVKGQLSEVIQDIEYRNIAPLYAEEEMKVCIRRKEEGLWETWIQGPDGGLAVRATAKTIKLPAFPKVNEQASSSTTSEEEDEQK